MLLFALLNLFTNLLIVKGSARCEQLKTKMAFRQDNAPADISAVLQVVVEKMNRELDGVRDVEINWTGSDVHFAKVGDHVVRCTVTRLVNVTNLVEECWDVPFTITDTDECRLLPDHDMAHKCQSPSKCVNTIGGYECECTQIDEDEAGWNVSLPNSSCPKRISTKGCCNVDPAVDNGCREKFICPRDPCTSSSHNNCDEISVCQRKELPHSIPNYSCLCPKGTVGNGLKCNKDDVKAEPKLKSDGVTLTKETLSKNFCGCTIPVIDPCDGFEECVGKNQVCLATENNEPMCACKEGYTFQSDEYGCVDNRVPILKLRCDPHGTGVTTLQQGDSYTECGVEVLDRNAEDLMRSLKISYSEPFNLHGCLLKVGDFTVTYSVATPWTNPPVVSITRIVRVTDLDECSIDSLEAKSLCPELLPKCDFAAGAKCKNTNGSYTCKCPRYTHGDGFLPISSFEKDSEGNFIVAPTDYAGGTSCIDNKKPTITLKGPNPFTIVTCRHEALTGVYPDTNAKLSTIYGDKIVEHSRNLEIELQNLIEASNGNELCSENISSNPGNPNECFHASDITHNGVVDLSDEVVIGNPVAVSGAVNTWEVPYNVKDAAGNWADTVFRTVTIEEVSVRELEKRFSDQYASKMEDKIASVIDDHDHQDINLGRQRRNRKKEKELNKCPECAVCEVCQENIDCDQQCEAAPQNESNAECLKQFIPGNSFSLEIMEVLQLSPTLFMIICGVVFIATIAIAQSRLATSLPQPSFVSEIENQLERSMREPINQYSPQPTPQQNPLRGQRYTTSPFFSPSINNGTSYPSSTPHENRYQITESDIYSFPSPRDRSDDRTTNRWG